IAASPNDVYNEVRVRAILASRSADVGAVFGFESSAEDRSVFTQFEWHFQDNLPALSSRFTLALPAGWRAEGITYNHAEIPPVVSGSTYSWQLRDLPFIDDEEASPRITSLAPRLAVSFFAPVGTRPNIGPTFSNWTEVSRWMS